MDFLRANGVLWFLELNPNGQFAWLDPAGENGLLDAVADEIRTVWKSNGGMASAGAVAAPAAAFRQPAAAFPVFASDVP